LIDGLFAKDGLAGCRRADDDAGVGIGEEQTTTASIAGSANRSSKSSLIRASSSGRHLGGGLAAHVGDGGQPRAGNGGGQVGGVDAADAARRDQTQVEDLFLTYGFSFDMDGPGRRYRPAGGTTARESAPQGPAPGALR
jgi:hypothetical protein